MFIGHGRSKLSARLQLFLQNDIALKTIAYESVSHVGESIVPVLESMLRQGTFAVLVLTAEDQTADGTKQHVKTSFMKRGCSKASLASLAPSCFNRAVWKTSQISGLRYLEFDGEKIESTFWELQRVLKREGLVR